MNRRLVTNLLWGILFLSAATIGGSHPALAAQGASPAEPPARMDSQYQQNELSEGSPGSETPEADNNNRRFGEFEERREQNRQGAKSAAPFLLGAPVAGLAVGALSAGVASGRPRKGNK